MYKYVFVYKMEEKIENTNALTSTCMRCCQCALLRKSVLTRTQKTAQSVASLFSQRNSKRQLRLHARGIQTEVREGFVALPPAVLPRQGP